MGIRQRLGNVREITRKLLDGARAIHEEANHPGRPPAHKVSSNPFYEQPASPGPGAAGSAPPESPEPEPEELPWYLKGEVADPGWDQTNPGTDPGKKWP